MEKEKLQQRKKNTTPLLTLLTTILEDTMAQATLARRRAKLRRVCWHFAKAVSQPRFDPSGRIGVQ